MIVYWFLLLFTSIFAYGFGSTDTLVLASNLVFRTSLRRLGRGDVFSLVLCAALCLFGMVKGLNQTGYTNTFYRSSRSVMEDEEILLDNLYMMYFLQMKHIFHLHNLYNLMHKLHCIFLYHKLYIH